MIRVAFSVRSCLKIFASWFCDVGVASVLCGCRATLAATCQRANNGQEKVPAKPTSRERIKDVLETSWG